MARQRKQTCNVSEALSGGVAVGSARGLQGQLNELVESMDDADVAEIYSPPRVAKFAQDFGLRFAWGLDLRI